MLNSLRRLRSTAGTQPVRHPGVRAAGGGKASPHAGAEVAAPGPIQASQDAQLVSGSLAASAPDVAGQGTPGGYPPAGRAPADPEHAAIWEAIQRLTKVVEDDHKLRLERIEGDLKWVMRLVTAVLAAVLGAAAGGFLPK